VNLVAPVPWDPAILMALDLCGAFAFALSGALLATHKRFDIVGLVVLAELTAIGGGVIRDLVLGATPPAAFVSPNYIVVAFAAAVLTFFFHGPLHRLARLVLVFDAAGLALYSVVGTSLALTRGLGPLPAIALGVTTAVGGGVLRDLLAGETPMVLRRDSELYAIPALLGAVIVVGSHGLNVYDAIAAVVAVATAFGLRILALWRNWRAPAPRVSGGPEDLEA
jgi:uncharacterized membrane protein YeiH